MVRVNTVIAIDRAPWHVFAYVTTPALWSTWHPATVAVHNVPGRPLGLGETVLETIAIAGRRVDALWTVLACAPPHAWEITTATQYGEARIVYEITPLPAGCRFARTLHFCSRHWFWHSLDSTLLRWLLQRQSIEALRTLKHVIEGPTIAV